MGRPPVYLDGPPAGLVARLFHCFPLTDGSGRWVAYPRQEVAMPQAPTAAYDALCAEFHQEVMLYLEMQLHAGERERRIQELWAQIKQLEAAQRAAGEAS